MLKRNQVIFSIATILGICTTGIADAANNSESVLFEKIAQCSGKLSAGEIYESYVPGLKQLSRNSEAAIEYLSTSRGYKISVANELENASRDAYRIEILTDPRNARGALSLLAGECRAYLSEAQDIYDSDQATLKQQAADAEEARRQERLRTEAETERLKAEAQRAQAEADRLRAESVEREEAAKQKTILAEANAKAKIEAARTEAASNTSTNNPASGSKDVGDVDDTAAARSAAAIETIRQQAGPTGVKVCEKSEEIVRRWVEAKHVDLKRFNEYAMADLGAIKALHLGAFMYFSDVAARLANNDTSEHSPEQQLKSGDMPLQCMILAAALSDAGEETLKSPPSGASEREITLIGDDPMFGSFCYSWAHMVRDWHDQKLPVSMMQMQAKQALGEPERLYAILMDTIDAIANDVPNIGAMVGTNRWNEYCVKRLSGRI
ncbi:hypothetical protein NN6n1_36600 [Shinella zoogloeoides]